MVNLGGLPILCRAGGKLSTIIGPPKPSLPPAVRRTYELSSSESSLCPHRPLRLKHLGFIGTLTSVVIRFLLFPRVPWVMVGVSTTFLSVIQLSSLTILRTQPLLTISSRPSQPNVAKSLLTTLPSALYG